MTNETRMVAAIENGTVIDHIPSEKLFAIVRLLRLEELGHHKVFIGYNLDSQLMGSKSIIKVSDRYFTDAELNQLSVVAPNVTLCIIRGYKVTEKKRVALPDTLRGIVRCNNPKCITNNEPMPTLFHHTTGSQVLRCHYCDKEQNISEVKLI